MSFCATAALSMAARFETEEKGRRQAQSVAVGAKISKGCPPSLDKRLKSGISIWCMSRSDVDLIGLEDWIMSFKQFFINLVLRSI